MTIRWGMQRTNALRPARHVVRPSRWLAVGTLLAALFGFTAFPTTETLEILVDGLLRTARIHVPDDAGTAASYPLVLAFHGSAWNGAIMEETTGLSDLADREQFVVVYPDGTGPSDVRSWNAGFCCSFALERDVDDLAFVDALIDRLIADHSIDPTRVYATGFSNGGMFAYRLAIERPERFAALAVVAGAMYPSQRPPGAPMPILVIHGTDDAVVPYVGGWGALRALSGKTEPALGAVEAVRRWIENNGCPGTPKSVESLRTTRIETYAPCRNGAEVVFITVLDGTHRWPVIEENRSDFLLTDDAFDLYAGLTDADEQIPWDLFENGLDASQVIWEFFEAHDRR